MAEKTDRGLVHIYTGEGKGKTTAALGVALRALGWGTRVCIVQFIKGYPDIGEAKLAQEMGDRLVLKQFAVDLSRGINEAKVRDREEAVEQAMSFAENVISDGKFGVVILDEINVALHYGLVDAARALSMIENRPPGVELILTGRNAPEAIVSAADYATEMRPIKHPYREGVKARKGIDY